MNLTRREALKAIAATAVLPSAASILPLSEDCLFEDLRPDMYYELQGGPYYKDAGGWGNRYPEMGAVLVETLKNWDSSHTLDANLERMEQSGYYLTVTTYFGRPYKKCGRIYLTKRWLREFYCRHENDTPPIWYRRYNEWHDALRATGWKVEYDRMTREELVAIGWKGVDIYRKDS